MNSSDYYFNMKATDKTAPAFNSLNQNLIKMNKNAGMANKSMGAFKAQRGTMQQLGYQVQDVAVQLQMGTNAMIVFGQQGSQILGLFGPGGAMVGALLAVGAALGTAFLPALFKSTTATDDLAKAMEKLSEVARQGDDGVYEFTKAIVELSKVGGQVVGAELEASLIRAENAAKAAAKGITQALSEIDADYGFSGIDDYVEAINSVSKSTNINIGSQKGFIETSRELGEQFGKTGEEARKLGSELIYSIAALEKTPTADKFEDLQKTLSALATSGGNVSDEVKLIISNMKLFFAESRSAAEQASFLREQLDKISGEGIDLPIAEKLSEAEVKAVELAQQLSIANAELNGNTVEAQELNVAFGLGLESAAKLPEPIRELLAELRGVSEQQQQNSQDRLDQIAAEKQAQAQLKTESSILQGLESQIILLEEGQKAQQEFNIAQRLGYEAASELPDAIQLQIDKLYELREAQNQTQESSLTFWGNMKEHIGDTSNDFDAMWGNTFDRFASNIGEATTAAIIEQQDFGDAAREVARGAVQSVIAGLVEIGVKKLALAAIDSLITAKTTTEAVAAQGTLTATGVASGASIAVAMAPAAAATSIATAGAAPEVAAPIAMSTIAMIVGSLVGGIALAGSFEGGGYIPDGPRIGGVDRRGGQLAIVHPGESIFDHKAGQGQGQSINVSINPTVYGDSNGMITKAIKNEAKNIVKIIRPLMSQPI